MLQRLSVFIPIWGATICLATLSGCADLAIYSPGNHSVDVRNPTSMTVAWKKPITPGSLKLRFDGQDVTNDAINQATDAGSAPIFGVASSVTWSQSACNPGTHKLNVEATFAGKSISNQSGVEYTVDPKYLPSPRPAGMMAGAVPNIGNLIHTGSLSGNSRGYGAQIMFQGSSGQVIFGKASGSLVTAPISFSISGNTGTGSAGAGLCNGTANVGFVVSSATNASWHVFFKDIDKDNLFDVTVDVTGIKPGNATPQSILFSPDCSTALIFVNDKGKNGGHQSALLVDLLGYSSPPLSKSNNAIIASSESPVSFNQQAGGGKQTFVNAKVEADSCWVTVTYQGPGGAFLAKTSYWDKRFDDMVRANFPQ